MLNIINTYMENTELQFLYKLKYNDIFLALDKALDKKESFIIDTTDLLPDGVVEEICNGFHEENGENEFFVSLVYTILWIAPIQILTKINKLLDIYTIILKEGHPYITFTNCEEILKKYVSDNHLQRWKSHV